MRTSSSGPVLLDTHVVLWWKAGSERLSTEAARHIAAASQILISPISCWEIAMLLHRKRIALDRPIQVWVADLLADEGVDLAPLTAPIAVAAAELQDFHGDPADRFLVATAAATRCVLLTKDRLIRQYARVGGVQVAW